MILRMYAVRDTKTTFLSPTLDCNDDAAKRNFSIMLDSAAEFSAFKHNPADFELYYIGDFDSDSGRVSPPTIPEFIISGGMIYENASN